MADASGGVLPLRRDSSGALAERSLRLGFAGDYSLGMAETLPLLPPGGLALVSRNAGAGKRIVLAGGRSVHGGSLRLSSPDRNFLHAGLGSGRIGRAAETGASRMRHRRVRGRTCAGYFHLAADRLLGQQF